MVFQVRFHLSGVIHTAFEFPNATNPSLPEGLLLQLGVMRSVLLRLRIASTNAGTGPFTFQHPLAVLVQPEDGWSARGSGPGDGELHPVL